MDYEGLTEEDFVQGRVKPYFTDVREMMERFYPSPDALYGYLVQIMNGEKVRYFTPEHVELRELDKPETAPLLEKEIRYVVEIIITPPSETGSIMAVSMDNFMAALEEIEGKIPSEEPVLVIARNTSVAKELQYPYFITDAAFENSHNMYEINGEVDAPLVEQYANPSEDGYLEIYIKRHIIGDWREAEQERSNYEDATE